MKSTMQFFSAIPVVLLLSLAAFNKDINKGTGAFQNEHSSSALLSGIHGNSSINYPKVAKRFASLFPDATNQRWVVEGKTLFAYFLTKGHKASAAFTSRGRMNYAIIQLEAADLSADIRAKIETEYSSYSIFNVREIKSEGYSNYSVVLENSIGFITIEINEKEIEQTGQLKK